VVENFYQEFPVIMERRANKLQLGQIMKSRNGIITVIHLEYKERQIVKNQLKFSILNNKEGKQNTN
jgi:hypothetical protein